jgi:hypothetical protein
MEPGFQGDRDSGQDEKSRFNENLTCGKRQQSAQNLRIAPELWRERTGDTGTSTFNNSVADLHSTTAFTLSGLGRRSENC